MIKNYTKILGEFEDIPKEIVALIDDPEFIKALKESKVQVRKIPEQTIQVPDNVHITNPKYMNDLFEVNVHKEIINFTGGNYIVKYTVIDMESNAFIATGNYVEGYNIFIINYLEQDGQNKS